MAKGVVKLNIKSHADIWGKNNLVRGNNQCDGLSMEVFLAWLQNSKEASTPGMEGTKGQRKDKLREARVGSWDDRSQQALAVYRKD